MFDNTAKSGADSGAPALAADAAFGALFRGLPLAAMLANQETGRIVDANPAFEAFSGYARSDVVGRTAVELGFYADPAERARVLAGLVHDGVVIDAPATLRSKSGVDVFAEISAIPLTLGERAYFLFLSRDVSERRRAADALRASQERYQLVFENTGTANSIFDTECRLIMQNTLSQQRLGKPAGEAIGRHVTEVFGPVNGAVLEERMRRVMATRIPEAFETAFDLPGGKAWFRSSYQPLIDADRQLRGVQIISLEITDQKRLEIELSRAQRFEAIGALAAGVAHDVNNILSGLLASLSVFESDPAAQSYDRNLLLGELKGLVGRGTDLTRDLLSLGKHDPASVKPLDLCEATERTAAVFSRGNRTVEVVRTFAPGLAAVLMNHAQYERVLLNLLINAAHAMPAGGRVTIAAENELRTEGAFVKIVVADNGSGMDEATQAHVFEPFFTTKDAALGTGLGLASVYRIVTNHGGQIAVWSRPNQGTAFTIRLPAAVSEQMLTRS